MINLRSLSNIANIETEKETSVSDGVLLTKDYLLNSKGEKIVLKETKTNIADRINKIDTLIKSLQEEKTKLTELIS
jgi:hypothetical protein